ncbi:uncharacterized protein LOC131680760 [Topomyia yanbarensis]|uniref:uncharacterized protein LOC131680760 n=1 Tax=Topomyia yanbarensis TaxID=2498891 RepID=UPI00273CEC2E|nr:uncharacterized protein LOC131680760 [Topomyia yanbarensis]
MCHQHSRWTEILPIVLLGIRSSLKEDLQATAAELTYGTSLRLPGEFFISDSCKKPTPEFVTDLKATMSKLRPTQTTNHSNQNAFVQKHLSTCSHVFVKAGAIKPPLTQPYDGPYRVIRRRKKVFIVDVNGKSTVISIDRLKAAFTQADEHHLDTNQPEPTVEQTAYTTRSGRRVRIPRRYW